MNGWAWGISGTDNNWSIFEDEIGNVEIIGNPPQEELVKIKSETWQQKNLNSTQRNPGSQMWRRLNGYLTLEEWRQKPCFICKSPYHCAQDQKHVDGWSVCDCCCHEPKNEKLR